jgi:hypothetical protein
VGVYGLATKTQSCCRCPHRFTFSQQGKNFPFTRSQNTLLLPLSESTGALVVGRVIDQTAFRGIYFFLFEDLRWGTHSVLLLFGQRSSKDIIHWSGADGRRVAIVTIISPPHV